MSWNFSSGQLAPESSLGNTGLYCLSLKKKKKKQKTIEAIKMTQQVKAFAVKPEGFSSLPITLAVEDRTESASDKCSEIMYTCALS